MKRIIAKYPGTCGVCRRAIIVGWPILWARGAAPRHLDCREARYADDLCTLCHGDGCRSCDHTGSRKVQDFAKSGGHARKDGAR